MKMNVYSNDIKGWSTPFGNRCKGLIPFCLFLFLLTLVLSCKDDELESRSDFLVVSETPEKEAAPSIYCKIEGGLDTLYVFSNVEYESFFQTSEEDREWIKLVSSDYLSDLQATRLIVQITPMEDGFRRRTGTFSFLSKETYLGQFLVFNQGFTVRGSTNFDWLTYGELTANPYKTDRATLFGKWTTANKEYGWTSSFIEELDNTAFCYGMNGYVRLGNDTVGGDLISPFFPNAIVKDTLLILSFDAVAYNSESGMKDNNRLSIQLQGGGVFSNGESSMALDLGYLNPASLNPGLDMWTEARYNLLVKNTGKKPITSDLKIRFVTGDDILSSGMNRVFLDNISLYAVDRNSFYLEAGSESMNIK